MGHQEGRLNFEVLILIRSRMDIVCNNLQYLKKHSMLNGILQMMIPFLKVETTFHENTIQISMYQGYGSE